MYFIVMHRKPGDVFNTVQADKLLFGEGGHLPPRLTIPQRTINSRRLPVDVNVSHEITNHGEREIRSARAEFLLLFRGLHVTEGVERCYVLPWGIITTDNRSPYDTVDVMADTHTGRFTTLARGVEQPLVTA